jgi:hypothetical protein
MMHVEPEIRKSVPARQIAAVVVGNARFYVEFDAGRRTAGRLDYRISSGVDSPRQRSRYLRFLDFNVRPAWYWTAAFVLGIAAMCSVRESAPHKIARPDEWSVAKKASLVIYQPRYHVGVPNRMRKRSWTQNPQHKSILLSPAMD